MDNDEKFSIIFMFGLVVAIIIPALSNLLSTNTSPGITVDTMRLILVLFCGLLFLFLLYHLGKAIEDKQDEKQEKRDKEMIKAILGELGYGKQDKGSEHFDSVL